MAHANAETLTRFYQAFQRLDAETMAACYAPNVVFSDPAFPALHGAEAADMWRMLTSRAQDFSLDFEGVEADDHQGRVRWTARYLFSKTGRQVVNVIDAQFTFENGLIVTHRDQFDLWRWSHQALGLKGLLLGWSPLVRGAIRRQAAASLAYYRASR
jgi:ketosteroid isomerase-like protein